LTNGGVKPHAGPQAEEFEERGTGLVSLTDTIETTMPGGVLVFHVFGPIGPNEPLMK